MMTRKKIIGELENRGYTAEAHNTIKNGVELEGIRIRTGSNMEPVFYTGDLIRKAEEDGETLESVVSAILNSWMNEKVYAPDAKLFSDREFVLRHLYIGM